MGKTKTTEEFIEQAKAVHGDKYDYSKTLYVKSSSLITITCPIHGDFSQRANGHTNGKGCKKCGLVDRGIKRTFTNDIFIEKANSIFNNKYSYELINYTGTNSVLEILCPHHGIYNKKANKHLQGQGCPICSTIGHKGKYKNSTTDAFLIKAKEIHGEVYDYSTVSYKNAIEPIKIICRIHGVFEQTPHTHLTGAGCNKCGTDRTADKRRNTIEYFIQKANEKHNNKYNYSKVEYKNTQTKVIITCPHHGEFEQTAGSHLSGNGCPTCARIVTTHHSQINPTGWSYNNWIKAGEKSKLFDSFKVYIIKCWNDEENFYKIGRTFKKVKERFDGKNTIPYKYKTELEVISDAWTILKLEKHLQKTYRDIKYLPSIHFNGKFECFNLSLPIEEIIENLKLL